MLGPILFNIFSSDLFLVISNTDFSIYIYDNTINDSDNSTDDVISSLEESAEKLFQWFSHNQMKGNTDKCHLIVSIKIDSKLNVDTHVKGLCKKANNKLRALARATPYMSLEKKEASHEFFL